eukprot:CAMPEP_0177747180 /NCGR_PEP_ID=MMETSP0484_2-20121128/31263_1 /TAXON_ID=354590 /ORGANISM="Rhodomonas lens, Strain RHODO" /LENGTH=83 /DNA_ID=CAMNT_0019261975 /DNA_START=48 /DNA_END=297 /DNA_ORIENTATION=-
MTWLLTSACARSELASAPGNSHAGQERQQPEPEIAREVYATLALLSTCRARIFLGLDASAAPLSPQTRRLGALLARCELELKH